MAFTLKHAEPILDLIGKYESRGDYEIVWGGIQKSLRPVSLTAMTIAQVMEWQNNVVARGAKSSAAGKYQIIRKTLQGIVAATGINVARKFDKAAQDEMGMHLLRQRGFQRFLDGQVDADDMMLALAKEWASFPVPSAMKGASRQILAGQSYYAGDGLNKAHATIAEVERSLAICRERYRSPAVTKPSAPAGSLLPIPAILIGGAIIAAFVFFM
ncbi:hypothetical protein SAMN04489859_1008135 [Paracoccus alcaliphilus]|uniref:Muramidase (Phage lambda lysozyme) n=1 Tax=Paracoccus alcaliphilus TaxID=34002 RepID=A0A1H8H5D1_9RHOB|nr:hypothetical protein [Paracoccus alcaliphilus]WCR17357.1 hypothetical protein JHW40_13550 [Paracoccus alcaliphilus]SEN51601.1 hypothetical protein SAMN04489859_1008135 [Paracoccus alcaliphilus]